ncbi:hypothetical protein EMPG_12873, partial [Blastomyces silverae]
PDPDPDPDPDQDQARARARQGKGKGSTGQGRPKTGTPPPQFQGRLFFLLSIILCHSLLLLHPQLCPGAVSPLSSSSSPLGLSLGIIPCCACRFLSSWLRAYLVSDDRRWS